MSTPVRTRLSTEDERGIAYSSWWQQMADMRPPQTPMGLWRRGCQERVVRILELSRVRVATPTDDDEDVIGLICYGPDPLLIHFVYTKFHVRRWGIASRLLSEVVEGVGAVTFTTMPRRRCMGLLHPQWSFDPFAGTGLHLGSGPFQETRT